MNRNPDLRSLLEPEAPRLSAAAAARLETAVREALERKAHRPRRIWRPVLVAAPALLLVLVAVLWLRPGSRQPEYFLLNEEEFMSALESLEKPEEALEVLDATETGTSDLNGSADLSDYDDTANWNESDWEAFRQDLEGLRLSDNGGES